MTESIDQHKLQEAISLATRAHAGVYDKHGMPYILHPLRVMEEVRGISIDAMIVAVLHDVVEDTDFADLDYIELIFGKDIREAVDSVTRRETQVMDNGVVIRTDKEPYMEFLKRVKANHIGHSVKIKDIRDNTRIERLQLLDEKTRERLVNKYTKALLYL